MWTWLGPLGIGTDALRQPGVRIRRLLAGELSSLVLGQPSFIGVQRPDVVMIAFGLLLAVEERIDAEHEARKHHLLSGQKGKPRPGQPLKAAVSKECRLSDSHQTGVFSWLLGDLNHSAAGVRQAILLTGWWHRARAIRCRKYS